MSRPEQIERLYIVLVALHSFAVGLVLVVAPDWSLRFGGWDEGGVHFFIWQGGVFHFVVGAGYLIEHFLYRGIILLVLAKTAAFLFLLAATLLADSPWLVPFSACADGLMGLMALRVHRWAVQGPPA